MPAATAATAGTGCAVGACHRGRRTRQGALNPRPATCLVVTLRRSKTVVVAIERIRAASAGSS